MNTKKPPAHDFYRFGQIAKQAAIPITIAAPTVESVFNANEADMNNFRAGYKVGPVEQTPILKYTLKGVRA